MNPNRIHFFLLPPIFYNLRMYVTLCLILFTSGCGYPLLQPPALPDPSLFEEGDIVLTFVGTIESWWIALCSSQDPDAIVYPCSHAEAVYRDARGRLILGGVSGGRVRSRPLKRALPSFHHVVVYRSTSPFSQRQQVAKLVEAWVHDPAIRAASFDYRLQDVPGRRDSFCCVGFLNEVFREAGMDAPFFQVDWTPHPAGRHFGELLGVELDTLIFVDSIDHHPGYRQVMVWENELANVQRSDLLESIARQSLLWYESGWRLKTSKVRNVFVASAGVPEGVDRIDRTRSQLRLFANDVVGMWERLERQGKLKGRDDVEKQALLQRVFARYRDRYFYRVGFPPDAHRLPPTLTVTTDPQSRSQVAFPTGT